MSSYPMDIQRCDKVVDGYGSTCALVADWCVTLESSKTQKQRQCYRCQGHRQASTIGSRVVGMDPYHFPRTRVEQWLWDLRGQTIGSTWHQRGRRTPWRAVAQFVKAPELAVMAQTPKGTWHKVYAEQIILDGQ